GDGRGRPALGGRRGARGPGQRDQARQRAEPCEAGPRGPGGGGERTGDPGRGRGRGVRPGSARRSAGPGEPAPAERPGYLLYEELHGRDSIRPRPRWRNDGDAAQTPHRVASGAPARLGGGGNRMNVNVRQRDSVTILDLKGKITIGSGDVALRNAVQEVMNSGAKNVLINMKDVSTIDSSGIGELVSAYTTATNRGAKLRLYGLPEKVTDI